MMEKKNRRKIFRLAFKLRALKCFDQNKSFRKTAKELDLDRKTIKNWVKK